MYIYIYNRRPPRRSSGKRPARWSGARCPALRGGRESSPGAFRSFYVTTVLLLMLLLRLLLKYYYYYCYYYYYYYYYYNYSLYDCYYCGSVKLRAHSHTHTHTHTHTRTCRALICTVLFVNINTNYIENKRKHAK